MSEQEELKYYDVLYDFASVVVRLNEQALDGETKKNIEKKICRLIPAFTTLCGMDENGKIDISKVEAAKKPGRKPKSESVQPQNATQELPKEEPEQLPSNFMKDDNGWGLCPVCRKKILKLTKTTKLIDFPAYCKSCKTEYLVSWWNVENKDIEYTRQVNDRHYIDRRNIRSEGMKGTGAKSFLNTRTSATERVAMHL